METEFSYTNVFLGITIVLSLIRFLYWKVTEVKADKEKPRKDPANSPKRMFTALLAFVILLQIVGIDILPFAQNLLVQSIGLLFVVIGFVVSMEARRTIGINWTHAAEYQIKKDHELITSSVYSVIRHPIYAGLFLTVIGVELILSSYLTLVFMVVLLPFMYVQSHAEEKILIEHFGEKYKHYKKRTFRFFPYLW